VRVKVSYICHLVNISDVATGMACHTFSTASSVKLLKIFLLNMLVYYKIQLATVFLNMVPTPG
jgi:hypothetical protein